MDETDPVKAAMPDEFSRHELLDSAYLVIDFFERYVQEHQALKAFPGLRTRAEAVHQALFDFYQAVGATEV